jgi:hypothetical protein
MTEMGDAGAMGPEPGGPRALILALLAADLVVWASASVMLASRGL